MTRAPIGHHGPTHMSDGEDPIPGVGGIQFDTDNEGGWLDITTNNTDANGLGFDLKDASSGGGLIETATGPLSLHGPEGNQENLNADGSIDIHTDGGASNPDIAIESESRLELVAADTLKVQGTGVNGVLIETTGGSAGPIAIDSEGSATCVWKCDAGGIAIQSATNSVVVGDPATTYVGYVAPGFYDSVAHVFVNLATGTSFIVFDSSGNPCFQVDADGSVHIKTGTSVLADL